MGAPPIPDNINTGQGVDGFGIGYFSRHIPLSKGGGVPAGYTRSTLNGVQFTYFGAPVFDNSPTNPLSVRTA